MDDEKKDLDYGWLTNLENYYTNQISWNLDMQLAWIGIVLGSGIGLFEIYGNNFKPLSIASLSYFGLVIVIIFSINQVILYFQRICYQTILLTNTRRKLYDKRIGELKWSVKQKFFLTFPKNEFTNEKPKIKKTKLCLIYILIGIYALLLFLEKQQLWIFTIIESS